MFVKYARVGGYWEWWKKEVEDRLLESGFKYIVHHSESHQHEILYFRFLFCLEDFKSRSFLEEIVSES